VIILLQSLQWWLSQLWIGKGAGSNESSWKTSVATKTGDRIVKRTVKKGHEVFLDVGFGEDGELAGLDFVAIGGSVAMTWRVKL